MWLTRRGYGAVAVFALAVAMAWLAGPRALNALAAPILVALVAGVVQLYRAGAPTVERTDPQRGFPGERRTVELRVEGAGVARVEDACSEGFAGDTTGEGTLPTSISYEVSLEERGEQTLGPTTIRLRDALGLIETTHVVENATPLLVFPRVSIVDPTGVFPETLGPAVEEDAGFDGLREYVPGDRLRNVHWKSTAKREDLLVKTYTDPVDDDVVSVVAEAGPGHADAMADATASIVVAALQARLAVSLSVPDGRLERGVGQAHQRRALELLAKTDAGEVTERDERAGGRTATRDREADVHVTATADGVTVATGDRDKRLDDLTIRGENPLLAREASA